VRVLVPEWEIRHSGRPDESFTVRGYAARFNQTSHDLGGFVERLDPHAFDAVLSSEPDVHFVWDHDTRYVGARTANGTLSLSADHQGLYIDAQVGPYSWAKDLRTALERRDIDQGSFKFHVAPGGDSWEAQPDETVLRTIGPNGVDGLYDVTVTAQGAYPQTSLAAFRSLVAVQEGRPPEEVEAALVASDEGGESSSQQGDVNEETVARREALLTEIAAERAAVSSIIERTSRLR
jgi:HK97 family phage prohead protease